MIVKLIQIGNSKGVRLPKAYIEKYELGADLELVDTDSGLLLKPLDGTRVGWEEKFIEANKDGQGDDDFSDFISVDSDFDEKEWEW